MVTLSTHIDTVPPVLPSREDDEHIWGRGACDTKGIIASMIKAVEALLDAGERGFGLLFVVGEERNSAGAYHAAQHAARIAVHHQRRAHGEQARARLQGRAAVRGRAPRARWRTRRIRNWANPPSTSCIDALAAIRAHPAAGGRDARPEHARTSGPSRAGARPT